MNTVVLWPPELCQCAVFLPDLDRARSLGRLLVEARALGQRGVRADVRIESGARTAPACAEALLKEGVERVFLGGDGHARVVLDEALRARGLAVAPLTRIEDAATTAGSAAPTGAFSVIAADAPCPAGVVFATDTDGLIRRSGGAYGFLPAWVERIRWAQGPAAALPDTQATLHAFPLAACADDGDERDRLCRLVDRFGPERVRLHCVPADLASCLRDSQWRVRLRTLVEVALPEHLPMLVTACHWAQLGLDPLLQVYAGNHIAERNADLIANIVP